MRKAIVAAVILGVSSLTFAAEAAPVTWTVKGPAERAKITGGPWVLAEADGGWDGGQPPPGYPTPNPGTSDFQPFYQSYVAGAGPVMEGFFDYRPYKTEEAIVAAKSTDFGKTWTFQSKVLDYAPLVDDAAAKPDDAAQGHPFVAVVGGKTYLYTLDRSGVYVDSAGLVVNELTPNAADPLNGAPAKATLGAAATTRTVGLRNPDGILAALPPASTGGPARFIYLEKLLKTADGGAATSPDGGPRIDETRLWLVETTDGINFTNEQLLKGLLDNGNGEYVGPRGTVTRYADGHWGMFYSAGFNTPPTEDSDAYHYIGYAESTDLVNWTVVNGAANSLLSIDKAVDPNQVDWYAGRAYAPNVIFSADGCSATMVFSGYKAYSPKLSYNDYRQIGVVGLTRDCPDGGADGGTTEDGGGGDDNDGGGSGADGGSGGGGGGGGGGTADGGTRIGDGGGDEGSCSYAPGVATGGAAWVALGALVGLVVKRRRARR